MKAVSVLDDPAALERADPSGMLAAVEGWATQWRDAIKRAQPIPAVGPTPTSVAVCGVGGSGVAGDVARAIAEPVSSVPVRIVRGRALPAFAGPGTLVVCVSYSGNTEEALICFDEATKRGATVAVVTSGGALAERAQSTGAVMAPATAPVRMPRAALPSLAVPVLVLLERHGLLDASAPLAQAASRAEASVNRWSRAVEAGDNQAKALAERIGDRWPIVWGAGELAVAAVRWKTQFSENAKVPAVAAEIPELCHNDIVGWEHGHPALQQACVLALRDGDGRSEAVTAAALELVSPRAGDAASVAIGAGSVAERLVEAIVLGDFVSVYLAILRGVDPTPIEAIARLKRASR